LRDIFGRSHSIYQKQVKYFQTKKWGFEHGKKIRHENEQLDKKLLQKKMRILIKNNFRKKWEPKSLSKISMVLLDSIDFIALIFIFLWYFSQFKKQKANAMTKQIMCRTNAGSWFQNCTLKFCICRIFSSG
jgi:hypothetical protein